MLSEELILIISMLIEANSYLHVNQYNFLDSHKKTAWYEIQAV